MPNFKSTLLRTGGWSIEHKPSGREVVKCAEIAEVNAVLDVLRRFDSGNKNVPDGRFNTWIAEAKKAIASAKVAEIIQIKNVQGDPGEKTGFETQKEN